MAAFASFARTGKPSTPELGAWPPVSFPCCSSSTTLTELLQRDRNGWQHMNLEHGKCGVVNYGREETFIWFKHVASLARLLESSSHEGSSWLRPSALAMAEALFGTMAEG